MVLGKLPVPGCPTNLDDSRARAYCRHMTPKRRPTDFEVGVASTSV